ncbi:MAG: hypothetical protein HRU01_15225 [Myxococcales bacterium]|nr:hypothetical protein [Myxococcales bacterium]
MHIVARVLSLLIALTFLITAVQWIADPAAAAQGLGMELLTGLGASTQIGDIGALFISLPIMIGLAQRQGQAHWLLPASLLLLSAAGMRTLGWATGNAGFGAQFIVPEVVMAAILFSCERHTRIRSAREAAG